MDDGTSDCDHFDHAEYAVLPAAIAGLWSDVPAWRPRARSLPVLREGVDSGIRSFSANGSGCRCGVVGGLEWISGFSTSLRSAKHRRSNDHQHPFVIDEDEAESFLTSRYSERSASIGSTSVALRAGM